MQPLPPGDPEVCSQCGADISNADEAPYEEIDLAELDDATPSDVFAGDPVNQTIHGFAGIDVRHSEMLADREQRRAGYHG